MDVVKGIQAGARFYVAEAVQDGRAARQGAEGARRVSAAAASAADRAGSRAARRRAGPQASPCSAGFLYFLAFPGIDLWPLSFVALAPLLVAMHGQTPRRRAVARLARRLHDDDARLLLAARAARDVQRLRRRRSACFSRRSCAPTRPGASRLFGWLYARDQRARLAREPRLRARLRRERAGLPAPVPLVLRGHGAPGAGAHAARRARRARSSSRCRSSR